MSFPVRHSLWQSVSRSDESDIPELYMKSSPDELERSYGQYGRLLKYAKKEKIISDSLYRQFAIEGFCDEEYNRLTEEELVYD